MELKEAIRTRHTVRDYLNEPVPEEKLLRVLDAARLAQNANSKLAVLDIREHHSRYRMLKTSSKVAVLPTVTSAPVENDDLGFPNP